MRNARFFILMLNLFCLVACSSSKQDLNRSTNLVEDSSSFTEELSSIKKNIISDSLFRQNEGESNSIQSMIENGDVTEFITEHIAESTDSFGNVVTITDRKINRKKVFQNQNTHEEQKKHSGMILRTNSSQIDSTFSNNFNASDVREQQSDYKVQTKDRNSSNAIPWWQGVKSRMNSFFCGAFLVFGLLVWLKVRSNKK